MSLRGLAPVAACALALSAVHARAEGVTSGAITGTVSDPQGRPVPGAAVVAVHEPSGSRYGIDSRADGRFTIPGLKVGGRYTVTVTLDGFEAGLLRDVIVNLGTATNLSLVLGDVALAAEITVTARSSDVFSSARTGAATTVARPALATLPRIRDRLDEFSRLTPQHSGGAFGGAFAGTDGRLNNITVDGSSFNTFGGGQPGDRTNVAPIATEALEEIQVSVAPYDVRQGNFVGAGVNAVTRGGGNAFRGSAYYWFRDDSLVGEEAKGLPLDPGVFEFDKWGGWVSGPLVRDRLFFFVSYENEEDVRAGTTYRANRGGETVEGNVTRVLASDLDALGGYLDRSFQYEAGPYEGYSHRTPATRSLAKVEFDVDDRNKISLRYNQLDSITDLLASNAASLGFGARNLNTNALNFQSSNYRIREDIRSVVGEWTSVLGANRANNLIAGYTFQDESRDSPRQALPDGGRPGGRLDLHDLRLRALHARQRAPLPDLPDPGQLHVEPREPRLHVRRERRALPVRERLLPGLAGRLRVQLPRRLLRGRRRCSGQPGPDRLAGHPAPIPGALDERAGPRQAHPAAAGVVHGPLRPGRVAGHGAPQADGWPAPRRAVLRGHGLPERRSRRPHVPRPGRQAGPLPDGAAARIEPPLVAPGRIQLGRGRPPRHAAARRDRDLHRPPGLDLDLEPDRRHRRADGLRAARQHPGAAVRPQPRRLQATDRDGCPGVELRPDAHRSGLPFSPGVAERPRGR